MTIDEPRIPNANASLASSAKGTGYVFMGEAVFQQAMQHRALTIVKRLRPDEPSLGPMTSDEQKWLVKAFRCLKAIDGQREKGRPGDEPYCVFGFGDVYVQFLASSISRRLLFEAVSAKYVPAIGEILTSERENHLRAFGFESGLSRNYSQRINIENDDDLGCVARLAFRVLKQVYQITGFNSGTFKLHLPKVTEVPAPRLPATASTPAPV